VAKRLKFWSVFERSTFSSGAPSGESWRSDTTTDGSARSGTTTSAPGSTGFGTPVTQKRNAIESSLRTFTRPSATASPVSIAIALSPLRVSWSPAATTSGEPATGFAWSTSMRA
jgi:hypothetical protein